MIDHSSDIERRITLRLLAYWEKLRGQRAMPCEQDINPDDIRDLWDNCFLIHVRKLDTPDYHYTYLGEAIANAYRSGLSEGDPRRLVSPDAAAMAESYARVIITGKPLLEEGEFRNLRNDIVRFRQCLLPLGEGQDVQAVFGGMRFKVLPAN